MLLIQLLLYVARINPVLSSPSTNMNARHESFEAGSSAICGVVMIRRRNRCPNCGQSHVVGGACACPRCHQLHPGGDGDCLSCAICGRWHSGVECLDVYIKKCCKLCGVAHDIHRLCPCPHCHNWHAGGCKCFC